MPGTGDPGLPVRLAWWTAWAAMAELVVLRLTTRTLIHIPGLAAFEKPFRVIGEIGRLAYYVTLVLVVGLLILLTRAGLPPRSPRSALAPVGMALLLLSAALGRVGLIGGTDLGWLSLGALLLVTVGTASLRWRTVPLLLLVVATWAIGLATILQAQGGGLSEGWYTGLLRVGEMVAIGACLLLPMAFGKALSKPAWIVGLGTAAIITTMLTLASSTVSILVLWTFGLPASLPAIVYGLALGCLAAVIVAAIADGRRGLAAGLLLAVGGGVGLASTYQTSLLAAGLATAIPELTPPSPQPSFATWEGRETPFPGREIEAARS